MRVRGVRGATQVSADTAAAIVADVAELLSQMLQVNNLAGDDLISILLTSTPDLVSEFPAAAARSIGLGSVPLLCAVEIDVKDSLPRVVRVLIHAHSEKTLSEVKHVYLKGASVLRKDLAQ